MVDSSCCLKPRPYLYVIHEIQQVFQPSSEFQGNKPNKLFVLSRTPFSFFTKPLIIDSNSSLKGRAFSTPACAARTCAGTCDMPVADEIRREDVHIIL